MQVKNVLKFSSFPTLDIQSEMKAFIYSGINMTYLAQFRGALSQQAIVASSKWCLHNITLTHHEQGLVFVSLYWRKNKKCTAKGTFWKENSTHWIWIRFELWDQSDYWRKLGLQNISISSNKTVQSFTIISVD